MVRLQTITLLLFIINTQAKIQVSWEKTIEHSRSRREAYDSILSDPKCAEVRRSCPDVTPEDDLAVVECLQTLGTDKIRQLNEECQHIVWTHIRTLIDNQNVKDRLLPSCRNDFQNLNCKVDDAAGSYLKCLVSVKDDISNTICSEHITRLENVAFYDFKWIANFLRQCDNDIVKLGCGRLDDRESQSETILCLQNKFVNVTESCRNEVFKLAEVQADNIKLDRQLYMACAEDQMRYCRQIPPGNGRAFNCLMAHRNEKLNEKCRGHLFRRQKLIAQVCFLFFSF